MAMKLLLELVVVMIVGGLQLHAANETIECEPGQEDDCSKCYVLLVSQITQHDANLFNLTSAFFPAEKESPVFMTVYYYYSDMPDTKKKVWFWSTSTFYLFQSIHVFQFTSLFFSDTSLQVSKLDLTLPADCIDASDDHMMLLTQRVSCMISS